MGATFIRKGDFQPIRSIDNGAIKPSKHVRDGQHRMVFESRVEVGTKLGQRQRPRCLYATGTISFDQSIE